jgi:S1-C subfamily serine protease
LDAVATDMEQSVINASKLYQEVSPSIVQISDGENMLGTGFIFDAEGHILTPQHVIEEQDKVDVILADGRTSAASIVGSCQYSDVAVLALDQDLSVKPIALADSSTVNVGEPVIVIGSPLELTGTVTSGIVSQTSRFAEVSHGWWQTRWVANLIQFDSTVTFGNSGSPLLNSKGEVIGMVIAGAYPALGTNIHFAVSANKVSRVALAIIEQGSFDYPWLGLEIEDLTPETVRNNDLDTANGALVNKVAVDSPAKAAGIEVDDVIVTIDGMPVVDTAYLQCYLGEHVSPDDEVTLMLIRDGAEIETTLEVDKR